MMMRQCLFSISPRLLDFPKKVYQKLYVRVLEARQWKQAKKEKKKQCTEYLCPTNIHMLQS